MDRLASKAIALAATALFVFASAAAGAEPAAGKQGGGRQQEAAGKRGDYRLGEIRILGSAEQPHVLFFLPRAKFRLLPLRDDEGDAQGILRDDKVTGGMTDPPHGRPGSGVPRGNR